MRSRALPHFTYFAWTWSELSPIGKSMFVVLLLAVLWLVWFVFYGDWEDGADRDD